MEIYRPPNRPSRNPITSKVKLSNPLPKFTRRNTTIQASTNPKTRKPTTTNVSTTIPLPLEAAFKIFHHLLLLQGIKNISQKALMTKKPSQVKSGYLFTFELNPQDKGTKETLILFPGFSTNCLMFLKLFRILCKEYHIVTFDYYGMGLSSREKFQETDRENILDT